MKKAICILIVALVAGSCGAADTPNSVTDSRDGKTYKTVQIGEQVWMAENLNYAAEGSMCYGDDESNCAKYGRLYNWETAMKACPAGWHLSSDAEWTALENGVVGTSAAAGRILKSQTGWTSNGNGTDEYGFSALPGGSGTSDGDNLFNVEDAGYWWSASEHETEPEYAYYRGMSYDSEVVGRIANDKTELCSVRCVKDNK